MVGKSYAIFKCSNRSMKSLAQRAPRKKLFERISVKLDFLLGSHISTFARHARQVQVSHHPPCVETQTPNIHVYIYIDLAVFCLAVRTLTFWASYFLY